VITSHVGGAVFIACRACLKMMRVEMHPPDEPELTARIELLIEPITVGQFATDVNHTRDEHGVEVRDGVCTPLADAGAGDPRGRRATGTVTERGLDGAGVDGARGERARLGPGDCELRTQHRPRTARSAPHRSPTREHVMAPVGL
jgi:hypothetical protein